MDVSIIEGAVSAVIAVIGGAVAIGVGRARRRKSEKVAEERRGQRARRVATVPPTKRRSEAGCSRAPASRRADGSTAGADEWQCQRAVTFCLMTQNILGWLERLRFSPGA